MVAVGVLPRSLEVAVGVLPRPLAVAVGVLPRPLAVAMGVLPRPLAVAVGVQPVRQADQHHNSRRSAHRGALQPHTTSRVPHEE